MDDAAKAAAERAAEEEQFLQKVKAAVARADRGWRCWDARECWHALRQLNEWYAYDERSLSEAAFRGIRDRYNAVFWALRTDERAVATTPAREWRCTTTKGSLVALSETIEQYVEDREAMSEDAYINLMSRTKDLFDSLQDEEKRRRKYKKSDDDDEQLAEAVSDTDWGSSDDEAELPRADPDGERFFQTQDGTLVRLPGGPCPIMAYRNQRRSERRERREARVARGSDDPSHYARTGLCIAHDELKVLKERAGGSYHAHRHRVSALRARAPVVDDYDDAELMGLCYAVAKKFATQ